MDDNVGDPEVFDDVGGEDDLAPGPVCAVVEHHPVLGPPHVVAESDADLLQSSKVSCADWRVSTIQMNISVQDLPRQTELKLPPYLTLKT